MHFLFSIFRFYPFVALVLALALIEIGRHFRRNRLRQQWLFFIPAGILLVTALVWVLFRGDLYSDQWVRSLLGK